MLVLVIYLHLLLVIIRDGLSNHLYGVTNVYNIPARYIKLNSKTWAAGSMTRDDLLDNGKVFDITEKNIDEFLDVALTSGDLFSPKKEFYMIA